MKDQPAPLGTSSPCSHYGMSAQIHARIAHDVAFWPLRQRSWTFGACPGLFFVEPPCNIVINEKLNRDECLIAARLVGEWAELIDAGVSAPLAGLAAARAAAQFTMAEHIDISEQLEWLTAMASDMPPTFDVLELAWAALARNRFGASLTLPPDAAARIITLWSILGTSETIMETGGDLRLWRDPQTDLNGYGCSHRPRPWAITFASSTASSISERGYEASDKARLRVTGAALLTGDYTPIHVEAGFVRDAIAKAFGVPSGGAVVLAASGTDSELLALALGHLPNAAIPITTILLAPEETGSGVPMAASGRHFAIDTANGCDVARANPIEGFRDDTILLSIPLRTTKGNIRAQEDIHADIVAAATEAARAGRRIIFHALDLSKTGLLAPSLKLLRDLRKRFGLSLDIVIDACQLRLAPDRIKAYLELDSTVQITGSKFLTGPPFAGAALISPSVSKRLLSGRLPAGLKAYFGRAEWPSNAVVARSLPPSANYGLLLRWHAALAEYHAFASTTEIQKRTVITRFTMTVEQAIRAHSIFMLHDVPGPAREGEGWDTLRTMFAFAVRSPAVPQTFLDLDATRKLYRWLNADCSKLFKTADEQQLAAKICHIGQPVALPNEHGKIIGWLRVSAGARLISGEPSHSSLAMSHRLDQEMTDLATVFNKIALLHKHWTLVDAADPAPQYR